MKKIFLSFLAMVSLTANAQYSQWTYGKTTSGTKEDANNGKVLQYTNPGHIMAGTAIGTLGTVKNLYVVKNDLSGFSTTSPYFNKNFRLFDANGDIYKVSSAKVIELKDGTGYGVGGVVQDISGNYALFYMKLAVNGAVSAGPFAYSLGTNSPFMGFGNLREDAAGGNVYLVGGLSLGSQYAPYDWHYFVHKIDENGAIQWSNVYTIFGIANPTSVRAYDATEDASGTELAVIGTINEITNDAFFTRIDPTNGNPIIYYVNIYGKTTSDDNWYSMTYSESDSNGDPRYLVTGRSNEPGDYDTWVALLDKNGVVIWSVLTDDNQNLDNSGNGIVERKNTFGGLDYYTVGTTLGGPFGGIDVHMIKGDVASGTPSVHYAYGGSADDIGNGIDFNNGSPGTGLAMFGTTKSFVSLGGNQKTYFIKSYFNGDVGCNAQQESFTFNKVLDFREIYDMNIYDHFVDYSMTAKPTNGSELQLCLDSTLSGGSNNFVAPSNGGRENVLDAPIIKVSPNPTSQNNHELMFGIKASAGSELTLVISDMLGRCYVNQKVVLQNNGEQVLPILLQDVYLTPGMYIVKVSGLEKPTNTVLLVK